MAIVFTCECGKRLQVTDQSSGKKVQCPNCRKITPVATRAPAESPAPVSVASVTPERFRRVQQILEQALDLPQTDRPGFLNEACGDDADLRSRVESLLAHEAQMPSAFLAKPALADTKNQSTVTYDGIILKAPGERSDPAEFPAIPGYEILAELGHGGMGVVYKAKQIQLGRIVALKMILAGGRSSKAELARFRTEAEAVARLQHPGIVQIHETGVHDGLPYFSLEYVAGGSLDRKLQGAPLPPADAARLTELLAQAMEAAHQKNILHRDLKPANIFLMPTEEAAGVPIEDRAGKSARYFPKIGDFGLAKKLEPVDAAALTHTGAVMGTPSYMAPEQASGDSSAMKPAVDVYALGAILYALLTGRPPFRAATVHETLRQVINQEPVPPSRLNAATPRDLETICLKCLQKEPGKRYSSARALADDLERFRKGEPIVARPVGRLERTVKWVRRKPALASTMAALAAVIVIAFTVVVWQLNATTAALARGDHEKRQRALAQVDALRDAAPGAVPRILADLKADRATVLPQLRTRFAEESEPGKRMRLALALLPDEPEKVRDDLVAWMLQNKDAAETIVVRDALRPHSADLAQKLWTLLENPKSDQDQRFRAACALSAFAADDPRWEEVSGDVAAALVNQEPFVIGQWTDALKGAAKWLIPPLADFLVDEKRSLSAKGLIAKVYGNFAAVRPDAYARLEGQLAEISEPSASMEAKIALAKTQASIGVALLVMGRGGKGWPLLKHQADPTMRSFLMERLAPGGVDPKALLARLEEEKEISVKRAILLSLGDFGVDRLSVAQRRNHLRRLMQLYQDDLDPGIHGAAESLLRTWEASDELNKIDKGLATGKMEGKRHWYINGQSQTMVVIPGPAEFWMGGNGAYQAGEKHRRKIDRNFAIASKLVTVGQFRAITGRDPSEKGISPTPDCPVTRISWYDAAEYCNKLSEQEGVDKNQWCYVPAAGGKYEKGMEMARNSLQLTGYRLPTEAEWEFSCRAGSETAFSIGEAEENLAKYGWNALTLSDRTHLVGSLKPNDLGLYDMHGSVWQWCQSVYRPYPKGEAKKPYNDNEDDIGKITDDKSRVLRGGSSFPIASFARSAERKYFAPSFHYIFNGCRVARTLPPVPFTALQPSP